MICTLRSIDSSCPYFKSCFIKSFSPIFRNSAPLVSTCGKGMLSTDQTSQKLCCHFCQAMQKLLICPRTLSVCLRNRLQETTVPVFRAALRSPPSERLSDSAWSFAVFISGDDLLKSGFFLFSIYKKSVRISSVCLVYRTLERVYHG